MKIKFAMLVWALIMVGCNAPNVTDGQTANTQDSLNPTDFPAYQGFDVEGYYGKIQTIGCSPVQLEVQKASLDFWFETSVNLLNETRFLSIYAIQGVNAYKDTLGAYFAGKLAPAPEQYDYYWLGRYTERAKKEILGEVQCDVVTPEKCKDFGNYYHLKNEDKQICDEWRTAAKTCLDVWFHCPGATYFESGVPVIDGEGAMVPLQLYQATYDGNGIVTRLDKCSLVNLYFVRIGGQWIYDHREFLD
jgi:hypothetical protein